MVFKSSAWAQMGKYITAIDYKTGKIAWRHLQVSAGEGEGNTGLTTTAGKIAFRWRRQWQPGGLRPGKWKAAMAYSPRPGIECSGDLHARRTPVHPGGLRRFALCVRSELLSLRKLTIADSMNLGWSSQRFQAVNIEFLVEIETKKFRRLFELDRQIEHVAQTVHAMACHRFRKTNPAPGQRRQAQSAGSECLRFRCRTLATPACFSAQRVTAMS